MKMKRQSIERQGSRYLVVKLHSQEPITYTNFRSATTHKLLDWLGEREYARASVSVIKNLWDQKNQIAIVKCSRKYVDPIKLGLALVHQIGDSQVILQTVRTTGTIASAKKSLK